MSHSSRRDFVSTVAVLVVGVPAGARLVATLTGCGEEENECVDPGKVTTTADAITIASACSSGHNHALTLTMTELTTPPAAGVSRETTSYEGKHTHVVVLTEADLRQIQSGAAVNKDSTVSDGHAHTFVIKKA
jgi:hypothetical protein